MFNKHKYKIVFLVVFFISTITLGLVALNISTSPPPSPTKSVENPPTIMSSPSPQISFTLSPTLPPPTPKAKVEWQALNPISDDNYGLITNGSRAKYQIALTFDACQTEGDLAGYDTEIIRVLNETDTPATLFLGGLWMRDHPEATVALAQNPLFELGNHSWSHLDFRELNPEEITAEIQEAQKQMYDLLGFQTTLFRLPFGTYNEENLDTIAQNGLYTIQWDVVSGDPDPNTDAASMIDWVLYQVEPGSIIIMHVNERGWHTAEALPSIIGTLHNQGYEFVTISELLGIEAKK